MKIHSYIGFILALIILSAFSSPCLPENHHSLPSNLVIKKKESKESGNSNEQIPFEEQQEGKEKERERETESKTKSEDNFLNLFIGYTIFTGLSGITDLLSSANFPYLEDQDLNHHGSPLFISIRRIQI